MGAEKCGTLVREDIQRLEKGTLLSDFGLISSYESQLGAANGHDFWTLPRKFRASEDECWLARRLQSSQLRPSTIINLGKASSCLYFS